MATAKENRVWQKRRLDEQSPYSFRAVKFMSANGHQVGIKLVNVGKRLLSEPLHRVRVKRNATLMTDRAQLSNRLNRARLIIGRHDRSQDCLRSNRSLQIIGVNAPFVIHGQV